MKAFCFTGFKCGSQFLGVGPSQTGIQHFEPWQMEKRKKGRHTCVFSSSSFPGGFILTHEKAWPLRQAQEMPKDFTWCNKDGKPGPQAAGTDSNVVTGLFRGSSFVQLS